jgi:lactate racemase
MRIRVAYGTTGLYVDLPDSADVTVVEPRYVAALPDARAAVLAALRSPIGSPPLAGSVKPSDSVAIVFSDITRASPSALLVPALLEELALAGVPRERITLFNATGTHRANTTEELRSLLGPEAAASCRIVQNDARAADGHVKVGVTRSGSEVWLHKAFMACSCKILTGFIEPHFFAGFSGGNKAVMPGLARLDTVMRNHGAAAIDHPLSRWAVLDGNPVREEIEEAGRMAGAGFILNVALNRDKEVTAVFAGHPVEAHRAGCAFVKDTAMAGVPSAFDIVVTSNAGAPLDLNLYQSVKGMSAAARIVRPGGAIVIAAACGDGVPAHGAFGSLMREAGSLDALLARIRAPGFMRDDQWQAHTLALIANKAEVYVHSDGLTAEEIRAMKLLPCPSIESEVRGLLGRFGPGARVCVMPEGPLTVPYISG